MQLMPHQKKAVDDLANGKILYGNVGSGKSLTAAAYYMKCEAPKDVYVITTARKRDSLDWEGTFAKYGVGTHEGGTTEGLLVVDSWNNIGNYEKTEDAFFIFDEQRLVGSGAWVKAFLKIVKNNGWIMLTATPGDTWMDYAPVFIANGLYKNRTQFILEHVMFAPHSRYPKIIRYLGVSTLEKYRNMLLVEAPFVKHTAPLIEYIDTSFNKELFDKAFVKRWNVYEDRPIKDVAELFRVSRKIVYSDPSRLDALREIMERHPKLIVFYNFDYELEILRTLYGETQVAEFNGHKHQEVPTGDKWVFLVQYVAGAEAWNCITTDAMVFYSLTYSYKNFQQAQGRIDRLDTPFWTLYYYVLVSNSVVDKAVLRSLSGKKMFSERKFMEEDRTLQY